MSACTVGLAEVVEGKEKNDLVVDRSEIDLNAHSINFITAYRADARDWIEAVEHWHPIPSGGLVCHRSATTE